MKIAISTSGDGLDAPVDSRFGRAPRFMIIDSVSRTFSMIDNTQNLNAEQGAGIQSAQHVVDAGVSAVITGHAGPKAFKVLAAAKIDVYLCEGRTIAQALDLLAAGKLTIADSADVEGHW